VWGHVANMVFYNAHLLNLVLVKKKAEPFRVLDVGCGDGIITRDIASFFENSEVIGLDANVKSLEIAKSKPYLKNITYYHTEFISADLSELEKLGKFDVVICSEVFEHVENTEKLLDIFDFVLKDEGYISFSTPSGWMYRVPRSWIVRLAYSQPSFWYRLCLNPEKHWREALRMHPAIQPSKFIKIMKNRGYQVISRIASVPYMSSDPVEATRTQKRWKLAGKISPVKGPMLFFYYFMLYEALMNLFPLFRIFESRFILLLQRQKQ
jgi:2-polyprenyl-3-methyl-5-hydroxy-6-metoxy-1,4-benzoquinol methylase